MEIKIFNLMMNEIFIREAKGMQIDLKIILDRYKKFNKKVI